MKVLSQASWTTATVGDSSQGNEDRKPLFFSPGTTNTGARSLEKKKKSDVCKGKEKYFGG